jgi:hemolysin activation/secretion protein
VRARPYQLTAFVNNYRPPSVGESAAGLGGYVRNLTGYGDLLELKWQRPAERDPSDTYSLAWRVPLNRYGTTLALRTDHGQSTVVEAPLNTLEIVSKIDSKDIGISHPVMETLRHKLTLGVNYVDQHIKSTLLGQGFSFTPGVPAGMTHARLWRFWQEYAYRSETNTVVARSTFSSNQNNNDDTAGAINLQPPSSYRYWLGQFQYAQKLWDSGIQSVLKAVVQHASTPLLPSDAISLGGINTVRGYRENQLLTDKGKLLSLQLDIPLLSGANRPQIVASPFFDWGRGTNINAGSNILSSAGLALKAQWQGLRLDVAVAKRLIHDPAIDTLSGSLQDKQLHVQLAYDFF